MRSLGLVALFVLLVGTTDALSSVRASTTFTQSRGSAATPAFKKQVAVVGSGGYLGALTFGFLQRAASLFGTGIGKCRCIGATPDTAVRLNRLLSKHFCLAQADESVIKLANLESIEAMTTSLQGWDALIMGSDMFVEQRPIRAGTYETTPNDKAWELYWDEPKGAFASFNLSDEALEAKSRLVQNLLVAAKQAKVQHLVVVDNGSLLPHLDACGIPYTFIRTPALSDTKDYSFSNGVVEELTVTPWEDANRTKDDSATSTVCREDLAALCVQCLMSLSWETSRRLTVTSSGKPMQLTLEMTRRPTKRVDQQWCINSFVLEDKLSTLI